MVREIVRTSVLGLLLCAGVSSAYTALGEASTVWKNSRMQTNFISGFDWNSNITPYLSSKKTGTHTLYVEAQYKNSSSQYYSDDGGSIYYGYLSNGSIITDLVSPKPSSPSLSVASSSGSVTVFSENDLNKYIDKIKETTYQNYTYNKYWNIRFYLTNYKAGGEIAGSDTIKLVHWDYAMPPRVKIYQDYLENYSSAQGYKYYKDADSSVTKINDLNYTGGLLSLGVDVLYADNSNSNLQPAWVVYTCRFENGAEHTTCDERGRVNIPVTSGKSHKLTVKDTLSIDRSSEYNSISRYVGKRDSSVIVYAEAKSRVINDKNGYKRYVTVRSNEIEMRMTRTVKLVQNIEGGSATIKYSNGNIWNGENVGVGETLTLTATPKPGYKFEYWTDGYDNHLISYNNTFSLRIGPHQSRSPRSIR